MGSRGPLKQPTAMHVVKGGRDDRHEPPHKPEQLPAYLPPEPDWHALLRNKRQEADAHSEWELTITELFRRGVLTRTDATAAIDYCLLHARVLDCERKVSNKYTIVGANGRVKNPVAQLLSQWRRDLKELRKDLGLTPMARMRLGREEEPPPDDDSDLDEPVAED